MSRKATLTTDRSEQAITQFVHFAQPREIIEQIMADSKKLMAASIHDFAKREIANDIESELRDRFALAALPGFTAALFHDIDIKLKAHKAGFAVSADMLEKDYSNISRACYGLADAMIKARAGQ